MKYLPCETPNTDNFPTAQTETGQLLVLDHNHSKSGSNPPSCFHPLWNYTSHDKRSHLFTLRTDRLYHANNS